ncbi:MAG: hypothetical protein ACOC4B_01865 [Bacteroidota bacterium]
MKAQNKLFLFSGIIVTALFLNSCSVTTPTLNHPGGNYNSITDDALLFHSSNQVIQELTQAINANKVLVVQTVNDPNSDMLAEKIYENLSQQGKVVGLTKRSELSEMNIDVFDKIVFFYPTVFAIENASTRPSAIVKLVNFIPVVGQIIGPSLIKQNTYETRLGAISLHARLVDAKTGQIEWMRVFQGTDRKRITPSSLLEVYLPI